MIKASILLIPVLIISCKKNFNETIPEKNELYFSNIQLVGNNLSIQSEETKLLINKELSKNLFALEEPVLYNLNLSKDVAIYRYSNFSYGFNPFTYRITKDQNSTIIIYKETNEDGVNRINKQSKPIKKNLPQYLLDSLNIKLNQIDYWNKSTNSEFGLDGGFWILEVYKDRKYHCVIRWSPETHFDENKFADVCNYFQYIYENSQE